MLREHGSLSFNLLGDLSCDFDALYSMAVQFLSLCYGIKPEDQQRSIIPTRIKVWYRSGRSIGHGIGKGKALKVLREHGSLSFSLLGDLSCDFDALYSMAVQFLSLCYGIKPENQQSSIIPTRIEVWHRKVSSNIQ